MASYTFLYATALVFAVTSASRMMMMASPEPELDPMGGPALALVATGSSMKPMMVLEEMNKVCPDDYPTGFTVLCHPGGPSRSARFYVNGEKVRTEYQLPYYIAGDVKGMVRPWKDYPEMAKIKCKLGRRTKVYATIEFSC